MRTSCCDVWHTVNAYAIGPSGAPVQAVSKHSGPYHNTMHALPLRPGPTGQRQRYSGIMVYPGGCIISNPVVYWTLIMKTGKAQGK